MSGKQTYGGFASPNWRARSLHRARLCDVQTLRICALLTSTALWGQAPPGPGPVYLHFNGVDQYIEVPSSPDFSLSSNGLTVSAWMRPDTLSFPNSEGSGYVYWLGKGSRGRQEWVFRMYNRTNTENPPRPNRISFYVFNPDGD